MADPQGVILRFRVDGHPEAHDLWWLPDTMLDAIREGHFDPLPASIHTPHGSGLLIHKPTEAIRAHRSDVLAIIEKGWGNVAGRRKAVALADLPFKDAADYPLVPEAERRSHFTFGGPLTPLTGVPNRPVGPGGMLQEKANLRVLWESIDRWQAAALAGDPNPAAREKAEREVPCAGPPTCDGCPTCDPTIQEAT